MLLCSTGCTGNSNFFTSLQDATDIKSFKYKAEITLDLKVPSTAEDRDAAIVMQQARSKNTYIVKLSGQIMEAGAYSIAIGVSNKEDGKNIWGIDGYLDVLDLIYKDDVYYINIKQLSKALTVMGLGTYSYIIEDDKPSYVALSLNDLQTAINEQTDLSTISDIGITVGTVEKGKIVYNKVLTLLSDIFKELGKETLTDNKGTYELELNRDQLSELIDILINVVTNKLVPFIDEVVGVLNEGEIDNATSQLIVKLNSIKTSLESNGKEEVVAQLNRLKENLTEITTFSLMGRSSITGSKGEREWHLDLSTSGELKHKIDKYIGLAFSISAKTRELAYSDVVVIPNSYMTMTELVGLKVEEDEDVKLPDYNIEETEEYYDETDEYYDETESYISTEDAGISLE